MQLGMIGLGRMGANMVRRLMRAGHECVVYDVNAAAIEALEADGAMPAHTLADLAARLVPPRAVWIMVPVAFVDATIDDLAAVLQAGDTVIDGGNSFYRDDIGRAARLGAHRLHFVDAGTSGGVWGLDNGYCLMLGGDATVVQRLQPVFDALAPGLDAAPRAVGRTGEPSPAERGWLHCGPSGAGHFVKMVHNGIEYGLMAAYAEGLNLLAHANAGVREHTADAETAPLLQPEHYMYDLDVAQIAEVWRRGSVVGSWLLDLTAMALLENPDLSNYSGFVQDSGEGRWTVMAAVEEAVPADVLTASLYTRFRSRQEHTYAEKVLSAMRHKFGGHVERASGG